MAKPKKLGETQALATNNDGKEYFKSKYSLKSKAGGSEGLLVGQEIYCLPLVKDGVYEFSVHAVKPRGQQGFKNNKFATYIPCHGVNEETGEYNNACTCCQLAQQEWDKFTANGKQGETIISFKNARYYIPILLLGNESGTKSATSIPVTKLTMTGRDYSYLELGQKSFNEIITSFKENLVNTGKIEYGLQEGDLINAIMDELQKHILKISINKPDGFGKHKKVFSFIPFENKAIGADTGSYKNITEGLARAPKLQAEVDEYLTMFSKEVDAFLTPWTDEELVSYVNGAKTPSNGAQPAQPTQAVNAPPKEEQVVIEEDTFSTESDDFGFDENEEDLDVPTLGSNPADAEIAVNNATVEVDDDDLSFDMGEDDFFGSED